MRLFWVVLAALFVSPTLPAESNLYWALANNDALAVWQMTTPEGAPVDLGDASLDRAALAVGQGAGEALQALAWKGVPLDAVDADGRNLLFSAAALGRLDLFERIQAAGARTDQVDASGKTLVHAAALSPHPEMLRTLLALGLGAADKSSLGITPLMEAALAGKSDEVEVLLAWGSVPEDEDYLGRSVRDFAVASGDPGTLAVVDGALTPWTISPDDGVPLP